MRKNFLTIHSPKPLKFYPCQKHEKGSTALSCGTCTALLFFFTVLVLRRMPYKKQKMKTYSICKPGPADDDAPVCPHGKCK